MSEVLAGLLDGECGIECVMELATPWTQAGWVTVAGTFGAPKPKNLRAFTLVFSWVLRSFTFLRFSRHPFPQLSQLDGKLDSFRHWLQP